LRVVLSLVDDVEFQTFGDKTKKHVKLTNKQLGRPSNNFSQFKYIFLTLQCNDHHLKPKLQFLKRSLEEQSILKKNFFLIKNFKPDQKQSSRTIT
jgi:hypothetical protein